MAPASHFVGRKGAARIALIPPEVLDALNAGRIPTVNLNEFLALDLPLLARNVARDLGLDPQAERLQDTLAMLAAFPPVKRHLHVARAFYDLTQPQPGRDRIAHALATHASDVARGWAAQWIAFSRMPLADKLASAWRFAADPHFGVRELAWMAVRDEIAGGVDEALRLLRPRGGAPGREHPPLRERSHAPARRLVRADRRAEKGALARPATAAAAARRPEPLRAGPSRYVQNSVANWLNDAAKTQPQWVLEVCARWNRGSVPPETAYILRRAQRSLG